MTTAKSMSSKLAVGFVAVAMLFAFSAPAQAQTSVEAQIQALLAQIAALQAQLGGSTGGAACPFTWTRDLTVGASGEDVKKLQQFLNSDAETRVAVSGAGSAGMETMTYGPLTGAAVAKFQTKYRAEILTPLGLVNPTTYFGASSRAKANALCSTGTPTTPTPGGPIQGGEGYLDDESQLGDIEATVDEGETENVLGVEFEAVDSDIRVERVDVEFDLSAADSNRLDRFVTDVMVMLDGKEIGSMRASEGSRSGSVTTFRFTGLNGVVREGDTSQLYVAVEAVSNIDGDYAGDDITVKIPANGIRAVDGAGLSETYFSALFDEVFSVDEMTAGDLDISEGDNNPDTARVVEVSGDNSTSDVLLLSFDMEADNQDITVLDLPIRLVTAGTGSPTVTEVVQSVTLKRGSTTLKTKTIPSTATSTHDVTFDDIDYTIDDGDEENFTVVATIKKIDGSTFQETNTIVTSIDDAYTGWDVEDAEGESVTPSGSATSGTTTFRSTGIDVQFVSASESKSGNTSTTTETGTFTIKFDVTAFGADAYISATTTASWVTDYDIIGTDDLTASGILTSTATKSGDSFKVSKGQTKQFTFTVAVTGDDAFASVNLDALGFGTAAATPFGSTVTLDDAVFTTDPIYLAN